MRAKQSSTAIGMYSISGTFTPPIPPSIVAIPTGRSPKKMCIRDRIQIAGVITGLKPGKSKRTGEMYAQATLEDTVGKIELIA